MSPCPIFAISPASPPPGPTAMETSRTRLPPCKCPARCRRAAPRSSATSGSMRDDVAARADRVDYDCPNSDAGSTFTPGPMVEEIATRLMKLPLAPAGRGLLTAAGDALEVLHQRVAQNRPLAHPRLDDAGLLHPELHRAALGALDRVGHVHGDRA